jgi:transposase|tara:strand:+ start:8857 stop:9054 length:198 start_codon:yes stop_codon:yes gene_type:complete
MSSRIAFVGGCLRWSVDQKLAILREAFGTDGPAPATAGSGQIGIELPWAYGLRSTRRSMPMRWHG